MGALRCPPDLVHSERQPQTKRTVAIDSPMGSGSRLRPASLTFLRGKWGSPVCQAASEQGLKEKLHKGLPSVSGPGDLPWWQKRMLQGENDGH